MATAGRILIIPKGRYNEETQYDMLDMVSHGGKGWVCKRTCIGIAPEEGEYWAECLNVSEELNEIDSRIDEVNDKVDEICLSQDNTLDTKVTNSFTASRALMSDSNGKVAVSAVTSTELGYLDGVTSNVQTQLDNKVTNSFTASRALVSNTNGKAVVSAVTSTELGYLDGVTSAIQTQLDGKVTNKFVANAVPYANADGKLASSVITGTELSRLSGVTGNVQTQLDAKLPKAGGEITGNTTTRSLWPATADTWNIGSSATPYKQVLANQFRTYLGGGQYTQLTAQTEGTKDTTGVGALWLGNNIADGTAGNARGQVVMYNNGTAYVVFKPSDSMTTNQTMILASKGGTIPTVSVSGTTLTINI